MVVNMGLLVYVVETEEGVIPVAAPFNNRSFDVLNVPSTPIKVTELVFDDVLTIPLCDPPPACLIY